MVICGNYCVFMVFLINKIQIKSAMINEDKDIEFFCISDEFNKNFNAEFDKNLFCHRLMLSAGAIVTAKVRFNNVCYAVVLCRHFGIFCLFFL